MNDIADDLRTLSPFPNDAVPRTRRDALEAVTAARREPLGRVLSCVVLILMCSGFAVLYGGFSSYFWRHGNPPVVGSLFAFFSAVTLAGAVTLAVRLRQELLGLPRVPDGLRREAEAEGLLASGALEMNLRIHAWNDAARQAHAHGANAANRAALRARRDDLLARRSGIEHAIGRYRRAISRASTDS